MHDTLSVIILQTIVPKSTNKKEEEKSCERVIERQKEREKKMSVIDVSLNEDDGRVTGETDSWK